MMETIKMVMAAQEIAESKPVTLAQVAQLIQETIVTFLDLIDSKLNNLVKSVNLALLLLT